jgi:outer membrane protein TolC
MVRTGALLLLLTTAAFADDSLPSLIQQALDNSPEILAAQKRYEAARQRPSQASSLPDPMFSPSYGSVKYPWPGAGLGSEPLARLGFMVSQEFPATGKRKLQGDIASKEAEAELQSYRLMQLSIASRVRQAYYRRATAIASANVVARNLDLLRRLVKITEARYTVGKAAQQDILKAQTQISILLAKRIQLDREQAAREAELLSLLNRRPSASLSKPAPLEPVALTTNLDELYAAARDLSPMLRRGRKSIERAQLAVNLARKEYLPDFALKGGYYNMGSMPPMFEFGVDIKVPAYFFRKQRPMVAEQSHMLAESKRMLEADEQSLNFKIRDDLLMAQTAAQLVELYRKDVLPQAGLTLESSLTAYETGAVDFLTVFMNYSTLVEYEMNYYDELQSLYLSLARLEEMTGKELLP